MISYICTCGNTFKFRDTAAGRRAKCRFCGSAIRIPEIVQATESDESDFLSTLEDAIGMLESQPSFSLDLEARQLQRSGDAAQGLAPCPGCGSKVERTAERCSHCHLSFRTGRCACCGAAVDAKSKRNHRSPGRCACNALPIIWGDFDHNGLCTNCGRICSAIPARLSRLGMSSAPANQLSCPWCAADSAIDRFESERSMSQDNLWLKNSIGSQQPKRRTDHRRLQQLDQMIETLKPRLRDAEKQERQMKAGNMIGSMFSAVLWGALWEALLGSPAAGVAVASVSGTEKDGRIREETGVQQLRELLATATMARTRLARASGYEDPVKRNPMKFVVISLTVIAVLMLAIVIAVATSS
jgi:hypothetical protein